jgi:EAL domain-containing protein (putative c-di-GMP-specific phosphodiesterase class I)
MPRGGSKVMGRTDTGQSYATYTFATPAVRRETGVPSGTTGTRMSRSTGCASCDRLPEPFELVGSLSLTATLDHTLTTVRTLADELAIPRAEPMDGVVTLDLAAGPVGAGGEVLLERLESSLSETERDDVRALLQPVGAPLDLRALLGVDRLSALLGRWRSGWLVEVLRRGALVTHFQPIVPSATPHRPFGHEALTRGVALDGGLISPGRLYGAATTETTLYHLDRAARLSAIRSAHQHGLAGKVFINFLPSSIYTPEYCLRSTFGALRRTGLRPDQVVFEVVETERIRDIDHLIGILRVYRDHGFGVALDDLGAGYSSLGLLDALRPDYVKLDRALAATVTTDPYSATIAARLLQTADELGLPSIAEGVEDEATWRWLRDHGATYQQGFLFARPATPPPPVADFLAAD